MATIFPRALPDASIEQIIAGIALPATMPMLSAGMAGIVAAAIRTPCPEPCFRDVVYVCFHLVPATMSKRIYPGCDDRALLHDLEAATPQIMLGACGRCGGLGQEMSSAALGHLAYRIDFDRQADDESYEHLGVWAWLHGRPGWETIYLHWSTGWRSAWSA
jgi:hypothetical protein